MGDDAEPMCALVSASLTACLFGSCSSGRAVTVLGTTMTADGSCGMPRTRRHGGCASGSTAGPSSASSTPWEEAEAAPSCIAPIDGPMREEGIRRQILGRVVGVLGAPPPPT